MVQAADERGHNTYLQWRSMKKDFLVEYQKPNNDAEAWRQLRKLMLYTWKHFDEIQHDRKEIDARDPYRNDNTPIKFVRGSDPTERFK